MDDKRPPAEASTFFAPHATLRPAVAERARQTAARCGDPPACEAYEVDPLRCPHYGASLPLVAITAAEVSGIVRSRCPEHAPNRPSALANGMRLSASECRLREPWKIFCRDRPNLWFLHASNSDLFAA